MFKKNYKTNKQYIHRSGSVVKGEIKQIVLFRQTPSHHMCMYNIYVYIYIGKSRRNFKDKFPKKKNCDEIRTTSYYKVVFYLFK